MADPSFLRAFRFQVTLRKSPGSAGGEELGDGGFQECSGLEIEHEVVSYAEGGRNDAVVQRVGRARYQNIVLKRGMLHGGGAVDTELWDWIRAVVRGDKPVTRYDGVIAVMAPDGDVVARWHFERGLPARVRGPELNGRTGEIAIEELHIAHERLWLAT